MLLRIYDQFQAHVSYVYNDKAVDNRYPYNESYVTACVIQLFFIFT